MEIWQEDQLAALHAIRCEHELLGALAKISRALGFEQCAYGLRAPLPVSRPRTVMLNTYPTPWQARYRECNYLDIDPVVRHGLRSPAPYVWPNDAGTQDREFWEDAYAFGLKVGWAQSSRHPDGTIGLLTLTRSGEPLCAAELRSTGVKLVWLAQLAHTEMARLLTPKLMPEATACFTERELTVLRWTAEGKTSGEIANILGIAERTVNFHVGNASAKLKAANKTAAVVRAAMLGLLY